MKSLASAASLALIGFLDGTACAAQPTPTRGATTENSIGRHTSRHAFFDSSPFESREALTLVGLPTGEREVNVPLEVSDGAREMPDEARALFRDLNGARLAHGLRALSLDPKLCVFARAHAADMVARGYFGHNTPEGLTPFGRMDRAGWRYGYAGENLALDVDERTANRTLYRSNGHRDNMLEPHYTRVGISVVGTLEGEIFVEDFSD
jgi:uncharacterized protein YkwD